jgi:hypothetical protein
MASAAHPRLRLPVKRIGDDDWALTGGVTNALVNPLVPSVLNPTGGADFGNLGFMRPQCLD